MVNARGPEKATKLGILRALLAQLRAREH